MVINLLLTKWTQSECITSFKVSHSPSLLLPTLKHSLLSFIPFPLAHTSAPILSRYLLLSHSAHPNPLFHPLSISPRRHSFCPLSLVLSPHLTSDANGPLMRSLWWCTFPSTGEERASGLSWLVEESNLWMCEFTTVCQTVHTVRLKLTMHEGGGGCVCVRKTKNTDGPVWLLIWLFVEQQTWALWVSCYHNKHRGSPLLNCRMAPRGRTGIRVGERLRGRVLIIAKMFPVHTTWAKRNSSTVRKQRDSYWELTRNKMPNYFSKKVLAPILWPTQSSLEAAPQRALQEAKPGPAGKRQDRLRKWTQISRKSIIRLETRQRRRRRKGLLMYALYKNSSDILLEY